MTVRRTLMAIGMSVLGAGALRAQHPPMPPGMTHEAHLKQMQKDAELKKRGTQAMGFDQDKTTHQFRLTSSGGVIEVRVDDPADGASRRQIRSHVKEIAGEFSSAEARNAVHDFLRYQIKEHSTGDPLR